MWVGSLASNSGGFANPTDGQFAGFGFTGHGLSAEGRQLLDKPKILID